MFYLGIFFDGWGFFFVEIGEFFVVIMLVCILGLGLWVGVVDKMGNVIGVMCLGCLFIVLIFSLVFYFISFWGFMLVFGLMMMFWIVVLF